jgi:hypothetical protein
MPPLHPFAEKSVRSIMLIFVSALIAPSLTHGEVVVFDGVTTVETPVRIMVLTKGRIFSQGGMRVDIYLDGEHLKKILTGGDGYGYLKHTPRSPGLKKITAQSAEDRASGLMLVMEKKEKAIIIEIEAGFQDTLLSAETRKNSQQVVGALSQKYKIIYLSTSLGRGITASWLEKHGFPMSVILPWQGSQLFAALKSKGVEVYAIIGSAPVISEAKKHIENRYTFEDSKDGETVQDWDEISELLQ